MMKKADVRFVRRFLVVNVLERVMRKADQNRGFVDGSRAGGDDGPNALSGQAQRKISACLFNRSRRFQPSV
jgi:hypothetical protein